MGVCESKDNLPRHISQHSIEKLSSLDKQISTSQKLRAANHNELIDKAKEVIDAANSKIHSLQQRCVVAQDLNEELQSELAELRSQSFEKDCLTDQYKEELDVQRETMVKWKGKIETLSEEIETIECERKQNDEDYANNLLSITDTLYKVHGDTISKLKYSKMHKKFVVFIDKINHLFYYDENGPKYMKIRDISVQNDIIQKQMNQCWFLVVGKRRSALFVTDSRVTRDKWTYFIRKSLNASCLSDEETQTESITHSVSLIPPALIPPAFDRSQFETEKLNEKPNPVHIFGQSQSPINIITVTPPVHDHVHDHDHNAKSVVLRNEDFSANGLKFNYPEKVKHCTIINNGHTVQINIPSSAKCTLSIYNRQFALKQFHFHTPSEHTIDNKQYEMEMHLVHMNEENEICVLGFIFTTKQRYFRPKLELSKSRAHLILNTEHTKEHTRDDDDEESESDDLETDDEWDDADDANNKKKPMLPKGKAKASGNDFLNQFWDELPPQKTEKEVLLKNALSFDYLFETASKNVKKNVKTNEIEINMDIFEYMGSLTTPPFTEGVQWLLSKTTHFINEEQLQRLSACWGNHNNARAVQKYFGRQVSLRSKSSLRVVT